MQFEIVPLHSLSASVRAQIKKSGTEYSINHRQPLAAVVNHPLIPIRLVAVKSGDSTTILFRSDGLKIGNRNVNERQARQEIDARFALIQEASAAHG